MDEFQRFRNLIINAVMATDIMDKEISASRKTRWQEAFSTDDAIKGSNDRKATILMEHLIQASDIAHTMQHWSIYTKWNGRLFDECYRAYLDGRTTTDKDPSIDWYQGELGFFDFYIIPLATKLKDSGVFGESGDEFLSYAVANRNEWEQSGRDVVMMYMKKYTRPEVRKEYEIPLAD